MLGAGRARRIVIGMGMGMRGQATRHRREHSKARQG